MFLNVELNWIFIVVRCRLGRFCLPPLPSWETLCHLFLVLKSLSKIWALDLVAKTITKIARAVGV